PAARIADIEMISILIDPRMNARNNPLPELHAVKCFAPDQDPAGKVCGLMRNVGNDDQARHYIPKDSLGKTDNPPSAIRLKSRQSFGAGKLAAMEDLLDPVRHLDMLIPDKQAQQSAHADKQQKANYSQNR